MAKSRHSSKKSLSKKHSSISQYLVLGLVAIIAIALLFLIVRPLHFNTDNSAGSSQEGGSYLVGEAMKIFGNFRNILSPSKLPQRYVPQPKGSQFYTHTYRYQKIYDPGLSHFYSSNLPGSMTEVTPYVNSVANTIQFKKGATQHKKVQQIMDSIQAMVLTNNCTNLFWSRTATQILKSRCFTGCTDYATAFVALARAKGIPASSVDAVSDKWLAKSRKAGCLKQPKIGHYLADVYTGVSTNNGWELVDPTRAHFTVYKNNNANGFVLLRGDPDGTPQPFGKGYKYRILRRGLDAWDTGITSDETFTSAVMKKYGFSKVCPA